MNNIRKLKADEIECRVAQVTSNGCSLLLYKTARVDRAMLNEAYGDLWQNDFKVIDGKMYGGIGIYNKELQQWLWRWDCGIESNTEAEKGQASDCFKRAGFKWGIGVELYSAPFIWLNIEVEKNVKGKYQLKNKYAKFYVKSITYSENGTIEKLVIIDDKGNQVFNTENKINSYKNTKKDDEQYYLAVSKITSIEELNNYWKQHKNDVQDAEQFKNICASRKAILSQEAC